MRLYGVAEIAQKLGARPETVSQWLYRGQLPEPTQRLKMGPVWVAEDIEPWIRKALRKRKQKETDVG